MHTSREVYHRLSWDPRFDPGHFTLGYEERGRGLVEIPLPEFVPDGDIPWHRIYYIRHGDEIVWDRRTGTDLIDQLASRGPP